MKLRKTSPIGLWLLLLLSSQSQALETVSISDSVQHPLKSQINGTDYLIQVALPAGYTASQSKYPVVYVLDANNDFPLVSSMARRLHAEEVVNPVVVVGISYDSNPYYQRREGYTPTHLEVWKTPGGAGKFLQVINQEVMTLIDDHYRTNGNNTLLGHSLGGLFGAYVLTSELTVFSNFIISSPSTWWDNFAVLSRQGGANESYNVLVSVGALENKNMLASRARLSSHIEAMQPKTEIKDLVLADEDHASAKFSAFARGLRWLFKAPDDPG